MTAPEQLYEMMARLGIEPRVLPQMSSAALRCETCRFKRACQGWLDYAPAMVNFAPDFCANADMYLTCGTIRLDVGSTGFLALGERRPNLLRQFGFLARYCWRRLDGAAGATPVSSA